MSMESSARTRIDKAWKEYSREKEANPKAIVLFQTGDFYEAMGSDAKIVADLLSLHLGLPSGSYGPIPVCGFPDYLLETYLTPLLEKWSEIVLVRKIDRKNAFK